MGGHVWTLMHDMVNMIKVFNRSSRGKRGVGIQRREMAHNYSQPY